MTTIEPEAALSEEAWDDYCDWRAERHERAVDDTLDETRDDEPDEQLRLLP